MADEGQTNHKAVRARSGSVCSPGLSESRCLVTFGVETLRSSIHTHQTCSLCQALHLQVLPAPHALFLQSTAPTYFCDRLAR